VDIGRGETTIEQAVVLWFSIIRPAELRRVLKYATALQSSSYLYNVDAVHETGHFRRGITQH
jgi:hypothetical protein